MTSMVYVDPDYGPSAAEILDAVRQSEGSPGRFVSWLTRAEPRESDGGMTIHESRVAYEPPETADGMPRDGARTPEQAPATLVRRSRIGSVLWRAGSRAAGLQACGRHTAAVRLLTRAACALEGRGEVSQAARYWLQLGAVVRARGALSKAHEYAARAARTDDSAECQVLAGLLEAVCWTDDLRLGDAEGALRTLVASSATLGNEALEHQCRVALARSLCWHGRAREAGEILAPLESSSSEPSIRCGALVLRSRILREDRDLAASLRAARDALALAEQVADPCLLARTHRELADTLRPLGEIEQVRAHVRQGIEAARQGRLPLALLRLRVVLLHALVDTPKAPLEEERLRAVLAAGETTHLAWCRRTRDRRGAAPSSRTRTGGSIDWRRTGPRRGVSRPRAAGQRRWGSGGAGGGSGLHAPGSRGVCRCHCRRPHRLCRRKAVAGRLAGTRAGPRRRAACAVRSPAPAARGGRTGPLRRRSDRRARLPVDCGQHGHPGAAFPTPCTPRPWPPPRTCVRCSRSPRRRLPPSGGICSERAQRPSALRDAIHRAARAPFPVLVEGESGSGKELVARAIHKLSPRHTRRFCAINCAALGDDLIEAELFGHARGAFTGATSERAGLFEEADGGTLFLDEVGELSARAQAKLLRVLQEGEVRRVGENLPRRVDVRVVAATNRRLEREAAERPFPRRPAVPARRPPHRRCRRCASGRGTCRCSRSISGAPRPIASARARRSGPTRWPRSRATTGPATCASCRTPSPGWPFTPLAAAASAHRALPVTPGERSARDGLVVRGGA